MLKGVSYSSSGTSCHPRMSLYQYYYYYHYYDCCIDLPQLIGFSCTSLKKYGRQHDASMGKAFN